MPVSEPVVWLLLVWSGKPRGLGFSGKSRGSGRWAKPAGAGSAEWVFLAGQKISGLETGRRRANGGGFADGTPELAVIPEWQGLAACGLED